MGSITNATIFRDLRSSR